MSRTDFLAPPRDNKLYEVSKNMKIPYIVTEHLCILCDETALPFFPSCFTSVCLRDVTQKQALTLQYKCSACFCVNLKKQTKEGKMAASHFKGKCIFIY